MKKYYIYMSEGRVYVEYTDTPKDGYLECTDSVAVIFKQLESKQYALYEAVKRSKPDKRRNKRVDDLYAEIYKDLLEDLKKDISTGVD